tara:strand:+ start:415 stop:1593 length:1179 start_codon:yes stop_codon:yes gene_type:complete
MAKGRGGFIGQDGLNAPDSPTVVSASAGDQQVAVSFTAPGDVGGSAITSYRVQDGTNAHGASGSSSPITVTGLTNDTAYTFNVWAINAFGYSAPSNASGSVTPAAKLGFFFGGYTGSAHVNTIQKLNLSSASNTTDFGDMGASVSYRAAVGTPTRVVYGGITSNTELEYITPSSAGNGTTFGDLSRSNTSTGAIGNLTYGLFGPRNSGAVYDFERITIASTGNATDYGDLNREMYNYGGGINNTTVGLVFGGYDSQTSSVTNRIEQKTITSSGASTDFGDLTVSRQFSAGACSTTRGVMGGGDSSLTNVIDYVTIASSSNATDFGDLTASKRELGAASSTTIAVFAGGRNGSNYDVIDQITIATTGNATDFGDLLQAVYGICGVGTQHGGIS